MHPHVCTCHYVRTLGGVPRVFAEYLDGGSLRDWIDDGRLYRGGSRRVLGRVLDISIQTAWGLRHAHERGVVHQDVKPANIVLNSRGTARVTDFGLARTARGRGGATGPGAPPDTTVLVTVGGMTPAYASPEPRVRAGPGGRSRGRPCHRGAGAISPGTPSRPGGRPC
ncbi:protein kinase [Streptomyces sp. NPDC001651]|uniref:protein kinase domain-containing protein n=1 Tax=Streptomyces sp. NPDC001651 TaxID=3364596 RepID=UPI0036A6EADE